MPTEEQKPITIQSLVELSAQDFADWFIKNTKPDTNDKKVVFYPIDPMNALLLLITELKLLKQRLAPSQNQEAAVENFMESVRDKGNQ